MIDRYRCLLVEAEERHGMVAALLMLAQILVEKEKIKWTDLKILRHYEWNDFDGPGEPITGTGSALTSSLFDIGEGVGAALDHVGDDPVPPAVPPMRRRMMLARLIAEERGRRGAEIDAGEAVPCPNLAGHPVLLLSLLQCSFAPKLLGYKKRPRAHTRRSSFARSTPLASYW